MKPILYFMKKDIKALKRKIVKDKRKLIMESIFTSIVTGIFSLCICLITNNSTRKLLEYRLNKLEEKIDEQNDIKQRLIIAEQYIKSLQHQINELKGELE